MVFLVKKVSLYLMIFENFSKFFTFFHFSPKSLKNGQKMAKNGQKWGIFFAKTCTLPQKRGRQNVFFRVFQKCSFLVPFSRQIIFFEKKVKKNVFSEKVKKGCPFQDKKSRFFKEFFLIFFIFENQFSLKTASFFCKKIEKK